MRESELKKELKNLKIEKGIASRKIGIAKQNGSTDEHAINEVKNLAEKIRHVEIKLKELTISGKSDLNHVNKVSSGISPSQFKKWKPQDTNIENLNVSTNIPAEKWDEYVLSNPNATIYHLSAIRKVIQDTFGHHSYYIAAVDDSGEIHAVLPLVEIKSKLFGHFLISVPFFNYAGILYSNQRARDIILDAAENLAKSLDVEHIEYRHCSNDFDMPGKSEKVTMLRSLPENREDLWSELGSKVRSQIKKSDRYQLQVRSGKLDLVKDFYKVFSRNMRDLGTPVYSIKLFQNMLKQLDTSHLLVLYYNDKPVSAAFLLGWRETMEIPWASTIKSANTLDANMKLYWEVLKFSIDKGYTIFDFGRSSKDASTYKFKKQWGAKPYNLYWHYYLPKNQPIPQINPNNPKYKLLVSIWKKLPILITNRIGPNVVKYIP